MTAQGFVRQKVAARNPAWATRKEAEALVSCLDRYIKAGTVRTVAFDPVQHPGVSRITKTMVSRADCLTVGEAQQAEAAKLAAERAERERQAQEARPPRRVQRCGHGMMAGLCEHRRCPQPRPRTTIERGYVTMLSLPSER